MRSDVLRRLPALNALKAFEAAARHESFTRAAEELCVTQGAVSHQVKALEATLEALWSDFLALRLSEVWSSAVLPAMMRFAHDEDIDEDAYTKAKQRVLAKKARK